MPLNLNKDRLRGDSGGNQNEYSLQKPPTTSQRIERLKVVLADYYRPQDIDTAVMSIVMTSLTEEIIREILNEGFRETGGSSWRKMESLYSVTHEVKLSVAAYQARLTYTETESLLKSGKATSDAIILMGKLQKRTENSDSIQREEASQAKPALSSSGLREGMGRSPKRRRKR